MKIEACVIVERLMSFQAGVVFLTRDQDSGQLEWELNHIKVSTEPDCQLSAIQMCKNTNLPYLGIVRKPKTIKWLDWESAIYSPFFPWLCITFLYDEKSLNRAITRQPTRLNFIMEYLLRINGINRKSIRTQRLSRRH